MLHSICRAQFISFICKNSHRLIFAKMSTTQPDIIFTEKNTCGIITLNRPKMLNSLNMQVVGDILLQLQRWNDSDKISHIIIEGAGEKAFCAGGDVKNLILTAKNDTSFGSKFFHEEYRMNNLIGSLRKPYIALLHGFIMGGGVGVSAYGSHRICNESCVLSMPETGIGLFPDVGTSCFLHRIPNQLGFYMSLTGIALKGADLLHAGIATHFVERAKTLPLKEALCQATPAEIGRIADDFSTSITQLPSLSLANEVGFIRKHFVHRSMDEIVNSLQDINLMDETEREWCNRTLKSLGMMSPTSLKITIKELHAAETENLSLTDCLHVDYRISQRCLRPGSDFFEGVRSKLIDKDGQPRWNPSELNKVSDEMVDEFFQPFSDPNQEWKP